MARVQRGQEEAFGNDSFLDVVANIVGILIILVVVASMRIKHLPSLLSPQLQSHDKAVEALAEAQSSMAALEQEVLDLTTEMQRVTMTATGRYQERAVLAQILAERQRELEQKRRDTGGRSRAVRSRASAGPLAIAAGGNRPGKEGASITRRPRRSRSKPTPRRSVRPSTAERFTFN